MVAGRGGGQPDPVQERIERRVVGTWPAGADAASRAGGGAAGGQRPVTRDEQGSIAIPTGALLNGALSVLSAAGLARLSPEEVGRQLLIERDSVRVILVRPADGPAYVDPGAADLGIVGKDILWETPGAHYELVDLRFGGCRLVLAVPDASGLDGPETWPPVMRGAAEDPRTGEAWVGARGPAGGVVAHHGSVGIGPQGGL